MDYLPAVLRRAREKAGLDIEEAANRARVSTATILNHESGAHRPSIESLFDLLSAYGLGLAEFEFLLMDADREDEIQGLTERVAQLEARLDAGSK
jgi:transcriptional regulator with XRE-family HTH domain